MDENGQQMPSQALRQHKDKKLAITQIPKKLPEQQRRPTKEKLNNS